MYHSKFIDNRKNALLDGAEAAVYIKQLYEKLYKEEIPVEVFTDNQSQPDPLQCSRYVVRNGYKSILQHLKTILINILTILNGSNYWNS